MVASAILIFLQIYFETRNADTASNVVFCCVRLQMECDHYRTIADEAYRLLLNMRDRGLLSQSQAGQLCDWLELVDEVCTSAVLLDLLEFSFSLSFTYNNTPNAAHVQYRNQAVVYATGACC